jgi:hypothetical protein
MNQRLKRVMWFLGLYLASLTVYAAVVLSEKHLLRLIR